MNSIPARRTRMRGEGPAASKPSGFCGGETYGSNKSSVFGKESNRLEEIEADLIHLPETVYTEYPDPGREYWQTRIPPMLQKIPIAVLMRLSGRSRSMLIRTLAGRSRPRRTNH